MNYQKDSLQVQIEDLIDEEVDRVYMFNMSRDELKTCSMIGQAFDEKMVTDEVKALFF